MTVAVAGLWELGHNVPLQEAPLWALPLRDFGVTQWHMTPTTGISSQPLLEWHDAEDMVAKLRQAYPLVFVTEDADQELGDFVHPRDACYVFGKANWSPFASLCQPGDLAVRLDTRQGKGLLWPHQALVAVLWHRRQQWP